ncbi:AAEL006137-PA [Aedes aegypti]|uniref:AAEL006137-PA n=1 Tax=Aedes aegypti TaxID=7159 RepID=Q177H9_AEDAE|nr:AAEL006137-PA [Aedes aegypti]
MVDKTNHLGFRILYLHSKGNKNNIAFSPCALASILVALYEGADGKSASEIHENLVVPYDKDILRVGYRDIHRRLRSYFYRRENLLSGLSLSSENITIRPEYESILKFYGYDLENIPEMKMQTTTLAPTSPDYMETTTFITDYDMTSSEEEQSTTESIATTFDLSMGSAEPDGDGSTTTESEQQSEETETTTVTIDANDAETTTASEDETTEEETSETPAEDEQTEEPTEEPATEGGEKRRRNLRKRGQKQSQVHRRQSQANYRRRMLRARRSPEEFDLVSHQRFLQNFLLQDVTTASPFAAFPAFSERSNQFQQDRLLDDTIEHNFYLSETETVKVPYKIYNTILKYAYIDRLQSTVLELELDSDDYKLIIILPDYEFGMSNLMKLLQNGENVPNMRDIVKQMAPSWVKTIVPKFTLKGNIILTSDLQNVSRNFV